MNEPVVGNLGEVASDLSWAINIFEVIQGIHHTDETKIRTVNALVQEEARIQFNPRELQQS